MAELNIERKKSRWPLLVLAVVILGLLILFLLNNNSENNEGQSLKDAEIEAIDSDR
ncbi:hypothetical protein [Pedobacter sp. SYSU D00535]|uniref:hypothetical protein n=1 Tax=Pedobacter sp. SYSU D00535 TaxID=2810308 RepID=UPI001A95C347|nr:hypothetical protein [Pedobacter sp. SYSU D00535]